MNEVHYSITINLLQLFLRLINIIIKQGDQNSKIKLKIVLKISNIMGRQLLLTTDKTALIHQKSKKENSNINSRRILKISYSLVLKKYPKKW